MSEKSSPFKGKPKSGGGGGDFPIPSEDTHEAVCVALIDMGTHHEEPFKPGDKARDVRKVLLVWEIVDEEVPGTGHNHLIAKEYTASFHEMASIRKMAENLLGADLMDSSGDIVYERLLGQPAYLTIKHTAGEKRSYAKIDSVGPVPKAKRAKIDPAKRTPFVWTMADGDPEELPNWLPYVWGKPVPERIRESLELAGSKPASGGKSSGDIPF